MLEPESRRREAATVWLTVPEKKALEEIAVSDSGALLKALLYYIERECPDLKKYFRPGTFSA